MKRYSGKYFNGKRTIGKIDTEIVLAIIRIVLSIACIVACIAGFYKYVFWPYIVSSCVLRYLERRKST